MHVPDHADVLPVHINPIAWPDTKEEAALLCLLLDLGFYPTCEALGVTSEAKPGSEEAYPN